VSYCLFVHPLARLDILDAVVWYEEQRPGLGLEMSDQVDAAIGRAADNPLAFAVIEGNTECAVPPLPLRGVLRGGWRPLVRAGRHPRPPRPHRVAFEDDARYALSGPKRWS